MLHWYPIKELMHNLTGLTVEKSAVFELTNFFEDQIEEVIKQGKKELNKLNQLKKLQGIYQKNRLDKQCIQNAIKHIYEKNHSHPPKKGRKVKKENIEVQ